MQFFASPYNLLKYSISNNKNLDFETVIGAKICTLQNYRTNRPRNDAKLIGVTPNRQNLDLWTKFKQYDKVIL